jgi:hypothetical protein
MLEEATAVKKQNYPFCAWWLEHDMPFSPRQMAQYLLSPHGMPFSHS